MNINWYKYVLQVLPIGLRTRLLFEFAKTLIWQVPAVQARTLTWFDDARFRASMNASVMGLQKLIERYLGIVADISELDGKPTDFMVSITGLVDEARIKAILDQYKLAGKSYIFESTAIAFDCEFSDWVCENYTEVFITEFADYVCESDRVVKIGMTLGVTPDQQPNEATATVLAFTQVPVASELTITGQIIGTLNGQVFHTQNFYITIADNGTSGNDVLTIYTQPGGVYSLNNMLIVPASDETYNYEINYI